MTLLAALFSAALLASPAAPGPPPQAEVAPPLLSEAGLRWADQPSWRLIASLYPRKALRAGHKRGRVNLTCTPAVDGRVACRVVRESPAGLGFGEAALAAMRYVRVAATDGGSPAGRSFALEQRFGNWPPETGLRDPGLQAIGLTWARHPFANAGLQRVAPYGDHGRAALQCEVLAGGRLRCLPVAVARGNEDFAAAAAAAMNGDGLLRATDGRPLEGRIFRYNFSFGLAR